MNKIELQETIKKWFNKKYKGYDFNIYYHEEVLGLDYPVVNIRIKNEIIDKGLQFCVYEADIIKEIKENLLQPMLNIRREECLIKENLELKKELSEMDKICKELKKRATPKKVRRVEEVVNGRVDFHQEFCDVCGTDLSAYDEHKYCHECGQAVDWSDFE